MVTEDTTGGRVQQPLCWTILKICHDLLPTVFMTLSDDPQSPALLLLPRRGSRGYTIEFVHRYENKKMQFFFISMRET
jgi:hypothetical protein